jgi:hypothetical protein
MSISVEGAAVAGTLADLGRRLDETLTPGCDTDVVSVELTKREVALLISLIEMFLGQNI